MKLANHWRWSTVGSCWASGWERAQRTLMPFSKRPDTRMPSLCLMRQRDCLDREPPWGTCTYTSTVVVTHLSGFCIAGNFRVVQIFVYFIWSFKIQKYKLRKFYGLKFKFWTGNPNTWKRHWSDGVLLALPALGRPSRLQQTPVCIP